jgi:hypothetical protein
MCQKEFWIMLQAAEAKRTRDEYLLLRRKYEPSNPTLVIVAESPPLSGKYFYDASGSVNEPLFAALMRQLGVPSGTKEDGLRAFQQRGWVLVDATYQPVDKLGARRDAVIDRDYPWLRDDLTSLLAGRSVPLILIKANVCRRLEPKLIQDGFRVLNEGCVIRFPSTGNQNKFHEKFAPIAKEGI